MQETSVAPCPENPHTVIPLAANQDSVNRASENPPHIIINKPSIKKRNINEASIKSSSSESAEESLQRREEMKMKIKQRIGYDSIIALDNDLEDRMDSDEISIEAFNRSYIHPRHLMSIINAMADVYCSESPEIVTGQNKVCSKYRIIENFESLTRRDIKIIVDRIIENKPQNVRAYIQVIINNYL